MVTLLSVIMEADSAKTSPSVRIGIRVLTFFGGDLEGSVVLTKAVFNFQERRGYTLEAWTNLGPFIRHLVRRSVRLLMKPGCFLLRFRRGMDPGRGDSPSARIKSLGLLRRLRQRGFRSLVSGSHELKTVSF